MKALNAVALTLIIVGGINWGLVGLFDFNLVAAIFGLDSFLSNLIYILVGLAALYAITLFKKVTTPDTHERVRDTRQTTFANGTTTGPHDRVDPAVTGTTRDPVVTDEARRH
ncbi:MAG: DUF378 domain-containing protein [Paracoccaceae bacterium]